MRTLLLALLFPIAAHAGFETMKVTVVRPLLTYEWDCVATRVHDGRAEGEVQLSCNAYPPIWTTTWDGFHDGFEAPPWHFYAVINGIEVVEYFNCYKIDRFDGLSEHSLSLMC